MPNRATILKEKFENSVALPFSQVLSEEVIQEILEEHQVNYRNCLYTPFVVLWAWVSQVLNPDKSLSQSVAQVIAWLACSTEAIPSTNTGAYSKARKRLPEGVLKSLFAQTSKAAQAQVSPEQMWCGRRVKAYDGTTVLMSDTPANQESYPQHSNQKIGCGFPLMKLVVWFCVSTGAVLSVSMAAFTISEWQLARELYPTLTPEDVVVADSAYGTYADLALVQQAGADGVFRKHHARQCDFRRGKKLGMGDHIVQWQRPQHCPKSMSPEEFEQLPPSLEVREVSLSIDVPGFRPRKIILVTTLVDPKRYPKAKLAELYHLRWQATEVNLRHLKTTLKLEMIVAKTPEMVRKELWIHLLAYNLLRALMVQAAQHEQLSPTQLSVQGTRQQFNQFRSLLAQAIPHECRRLFEILLNLICCQLLPCRPNRAEPRVVKRRPKPFPRMMQSRPILKAKLAA
jgi:hypothetical protein